MTRYRIGVKATAVHYYEIDADTLADALNTCTDGEYSYEADEYWHALDLPDAAADD